MQWYVEDDIYGSDHYPIIMKEISPTQSMREPKFKLDKADWNKYHNETFIDPIDEILKISSIDTIIEFFNDHIISAATTSIPKSSDRPQPHRVP